MENKETTIYDLLTLLKEHGGSIVLSTSLTKEWQDQAIASKRFCVFGHTELIWEPKIVGLPEDDEALAEFEKWFPLPVDLPESLKDNSFLFKKKINPGDN